MYTLRLEVVGCIICNQYGNSKNIGKPQDESRIHVVPALKPVLQSVTDGSSSVPPLLNAIQSLYHILLVRLYMKNTPISI